MRRYLPLLALLGLVLSGCSLGQPTPPDSVTDDGAALKGNVFSNQAGEVTYWFEYGTTTAFGTATPDRTIEFPEGTTASDPPVPVSETISGLEPGTTYFYRICTSPGVEPGSRGCVNQHETFTTAFTDTTVADFTAGTTGADTYVGATGTGDDGEVVLRPAVGEEFDGTSLPAGWTSSAWSDGGSVTFSGGTATIDGALLRTLTAFGSGRSLEFTGAFSGANFQHLGFGVDFDQDVSWAIFSTGSGPGFQARTNGPAVQNTDLGGSATDAHRYRIEWSAGQVRFFVDGVSVATHDVTLGDMRVAGSDFTVGGGGTTWHWARLSPYASAGTFTSRVFDSGQAGSDWTTLDAVTGTPSDTALTIETRSGDTATPDGTWSGWEAVGSGGTIASPDARHLQYRVALSPTDETRTPVVERVTLRVAP
jgi:hypothetical protein